METNINLGAMIKMSRESAVLGQYDTSHSQYKTALDHIELGLNWKGMSPALEFKWKDTIELIKAEMKMVSRMREDLEQLSQKPKPQSVKKPERDFQDDAKPNGHKAQVSPNKYNQQPHPSPSQNEPTRKPVPAPVRSEPQYRQRD